MLDHMMILIMRINEEKDLLDLENLSEKMCFDTNNNINYTNMLIDKTLKI